MPSAILGYRASEMGYVDPKGTLDHTEYHGIGKDDILGIGAQDAAVKHPECIEVRRAALEY